MAFDTDPNNQSDQPIGRHAAGNHARQQPQSTQSMPSQSAPPRRPQQTGAFSPVVSPAEVGRSRRGKGGGQGPYMNLGPRKRSGAKVAVIAVLVIVVFIGALVGLEFGLNDGKVHHGIKVQGVEIGGMDKAEATQTLQTALDSKLAGATVRVTPSADVVKRLEESTVDDASGEVPAGEEGAEEGSVDGEASGGGSSSGGESLAWSFSAADLGASVDASALVDEAMEVGRITGFDDFASGAGARLSSWLGQVDLSATVNYDEAALETALQTIDDAIGVSMVNCGIAINADGVAQVTAGRVGEKVDAEAFAPKATAMLLGATTTSFDVPMTEIPLDIDSDEAQAVADSITAAIADPVTFVYGDDSWQIWAPMLGEWTKIETEGEGDNAKLVASIDAAKAYDGLQGQMGSVGYGTAGNATFDVSSGVPVITGGTMGIGPDIKTGVHTLGDMLYGTAEAGDRTIMLEEAEVEPEITAEDAESMGVVELITSYKLGYGSNGGTNREYNIELCLDTLNGSLIAPGQNWNWNDIVGNCDEAAGYKEANVIVNNKYEKSSGGGICNVATGVFNAAYEAGLPIVERTNHSLYQPNYPLGRDAAVSWEYPTLIFTNDTDHYILVTADYDGVDMTISIWGTSPHRTVESTNSDWSGTDKDGKSITNYRTVKDADGNVISEDTFPSYFPPVPEDDD
ncbi:VanW family protein [Raoultibacter massiliensis]|uniref:VanW family protein n=1 Tax=Raoultibacter massiliensis TaxID=1852371 RepID=UPI003A901149